MISQRSESGLPSPQQPYQGIALLADPIHQYIPFTVPLDTVPEAAESTEKDVIDAPWMQRLRAIRQLQTAFWVYPSAEHSRFQHSLGAMHVAGRFARQLYPSLHSVTPTCPSFPYVEEVLRISALLHDIGHGPFGHFFDDNYLAQYGLSHELLGEQIILQQLAPLLQRLRRSPSGPFADDEILQPQYVAYLMQKKIPRHDAMPQWLRHLKPVLSGIYTADNLDYVLRDAYMCGIAVGPVDLERLLHYSFITERGLTLHKAGVGALTMFLNTRLYLYTNVYFHRTTRAIDLHLREIFADTMSYIFPGNPLDTLEQYLHLTDWSLLETVRHWVHDPHPRKRALGQEWQHLLQRQVKWKMAYDATLSIRRWQRHTASALDTAQLATYIRYSLPPALRHVPFQLDTAIQDPRNLNPLVLGESPLYIYDPATATIHTELLEDILEHIPAEMVQYRLYTTDRRHTALLAEACEQALTRVFMRDPAQNASHTWHLRH